MTTNQFKSMEKGKNSKKKKFKYKYNIQFIKFIKICKWKFFRHLTFTTENKHWGSL
jgi:hypothetical protein